MTAHMNIALRHPRSSYHSVDDQDDEEPATTWRAVAIESEILAVLVAQAEPGERIETAFRRKEAELVTCFDRLSVLDARELHRRFQLRFRDDVLAEQFGRMIAERRERLLSYLADARRREAIRAWRRK